MSYRHLDRLSSERTEPECEPCLSAAAAAAEISHRTRELAITYGIGARLHHGERHWDDIREELARGWDRLRGNDRVPWQNVEGDVEGAWRLVLAD
ncbi:hypothetical protein AZ78_2339 [Lysobacter capsici AZ78]|jgi:hypothetical protein|uniref:Uncharacterized protein n=1 Tax=Lysobacter capsici AZ78 TaxID=1444315 RepID=A0A108U927_9GAMM|nr:hypothetical protein [Lysobacter capsici]KWS04789.1 hypothetical protein AZ78_2339 [Lysobacter capsici AZ78]